jgi:hypothetical protein
VGFLGVLPEYQHTGVAAALYLEHFNTAARSRQKTGEASFILEVNTSMNRGLEAMGGRLVKRDARKPLAAARCDGPTGRHHDRSAFDPRANGNH